MRSNASQKGTDYFNGDMLHRDVSHLQNLLQLDKTSWCQVWIRISHACYFYLQLLLNIHHVEGTGLSVFLFLSTDRCHGSRTLEFWVADYSSCIYQ